MADQQRRAADNRPTAIDRATGLPAMTIGFMGTLAVLIWIASQEFNDIIDAQDDILTVVEDVADRQSKYIGQDGSLTILIQDARDREVERCIWLAVRQNDDSIPCT